MKLTDVPGGTSVLIDSTIFIYHFVGASSQCSEFLERCERGELRGYTSVVVLTETAHRLMTIEAVAAGVAAAGNVVRKLRQKPALVKRLHLYRAQIESVPLMGIQVAPLDLGTFIEAGDLQKEHGLLVNDSLIAAAAFALRVPAIASADPDFKRLELEFYCPTDLAL